MLNWNRGARPTLGGRRSGLLARNGEIALTVVIQEALQLRPPVGRVGRVPAVPTVTIPTYRKLCGSISIASRTEFGTRNCPTHALNAACNGTPLAAFTNRRTR